MGTGFGVFDNARAASAEGFPEVKKGWDNHIFDTFEEAKAYANAWLGPYGGVKFELGVPYQYTGAGDSIRIIQVQKPSSEQEELTSLCISLVRSKGDISAIDGQIAVSHPLFEKLERMVDPKVERTANQVIKQILEGLTGTDGESIADIANQVLPQKVEYAGDGVFYQEE